MSSVSLVEVGNLLKPVKDLIDSLHTSKEEKATLEIAYYNAQVAAAKSFAGFQTDIIKEEMKGQSAAQRNWRPHLMYVFIAILAWNFIVSRMVTWVSGVLCVAFNVEPEVLAMLEAPVLEVPTQMWTLLTFGVTGYIGLRSAFDKGGLAKMFEAIGKKKKGSE